MRPQMNRVFKVWPLLVIRVWIVSMDFAFDKLT